MGVFACLLSLVNVSPRVSRAGCHRQRSQHATTGKEEDAFLAVLQNTLEILFLN